MKVKKIIALLMASVCLFGCACKPDDEVDSVGNTNGVIDETENPVHYIDGTLHEVYVDFENPVSDFIKAGKTDYKVVFGDVTCGRSAGLITEHVYKATGVNMQSLDMSAIATANVNLDTSYIFVGCEEVYQGLGFDVPAYDDIGVSGYQICTYGKNVFINAYSIYGYQMGAIAFLREVIGYDMLAEDCVVYEKDGAKMPNMDIVERPDFDYRNPSGTQITPVEELGMGYTYEDPIINTGHGWPHNWYDFVSKEEADANPDWASSDETHWQGCWTAHGNKDSYEGLIDHLTEKVKGYLVANPSQDSIMIGQHDVGVETPNVENCSCAACSASYAYYGTMAGAWLSLCNRVSVKVNEWLETDAGRAAFGLKEGEKKDWNLIALIYHSNINPPVEKQNGVYVLDADGRGVPKREMWFNGDGTMEEWDSVWGDRETGVIKAWSEQNELIYSAPNVQFMFAASSASYSHSYYEEINAGWKSLIDGWAGLGGEFYIWLYCLNSRGTLYPANTFDTAFETTRYFKTVGAKWIYWQGQFQNKNNAGFCKLRNYLNSKVQFDVNSDYQYYLTKFFKYYYGTAGELMKGYFDQLTAHCRWIEEEKGITSVHHSSSYLNAQNWPEGLLRGWNNLMTDAYDVIEVDYKATNPELYETYKRHIMAEKLFPTYVLCTDYAKSFDAGELKALRLQFIDDFYALGNTSYWELGLMTEIIDTWDLD